MSKIISFVQEAKQELHRVEWPTRKETIKLTLAVIFVSLIVAVYLGALDYGFTKVLELFI